jgi:hypothetical protein
VRRAELREYDRALLRLFQLEPVRVVVEFELRRAFPRAFERREELARLVVRFEVRPVDRVERLLERLLDDRLDELELLDLFALQAFWKLLISMRRTFGPPEVGFHQQHGT